MATSNSHTDDHVSGILNKLQAAKQSTANAEPGAREKMLSLSLQLTAALETPSEMIQRIGWAEPAGFAATRIAIDLQIFEKLNNQAGAPLSVQELAKETGADAALIGRTMKHLAATNIIAEAGTDNYKSTPTSRALTEPKYRDGICYTFDVAGPSFHGIPEYLKETKYQNPGNIFDGPFQYAHKTKNPFFVWLAERPENAAQFNNYMSGYRQGKRSWMDEDFYPVPERLAGSSTPEEEAVLLVDVGGGLGHDLAEFKAKHPDTNPSVRGRLVLQDKPDVISQIAPETAIGLELSAHDFFTEQPVRGAQAYFLHSVLHDWDDATCIKILSNLAPAMKSGFSKLLINEYVVPDVGAAWSVTSMDWLMMALGAVKERTEQQWRALLEQAGFRVVQIWTYDQGTESLIEAELAG